MSPLASIKCLRVWGASDKNVYREVSVVLTVVVSSLSQHFLSLCKVVRNSTPVAKSTTFCICCFICSYFYFYRMIGEKGNCGLVWF